MPVDTSILGNVAVCAALALVALAARPDAGVRTLAAISVLALALTLRERAAGYVLTTAVVFLACGIASAVARRTPSENRTRWRLSLLLIAAIIAGYAYLQLSETTSVVVAFDGWRFAVLAFDMWLTLRLVVFVWEVGSGRVATPRAWDYAAWILNPFTIFGPILRYGAFLEQVRSRESAADSTGDRRVPGRTLVLGSVQLAAGYALGFAHSTLLPAAALPRTADRLVSAFLLAPWSIYLVIAGYMKLMEAFARPWGLVLGPSFDRAFVQRNVADFWTRWNMTATAVFRDYAFYARWGLARPSMYVNTVIVFVLVGLWHGANEYWLVWGMMHGLGFCVFLVYRRHGAGLRRACAWVPEGCRSAIARTVTYVFVCSCWFAPPWIIRTAAGYIATAWN